MVTIPTKVTSLDPAAAAVLLNLIDFLRDKPPQESASRKEFLRESLPSPSKAEEAYERIIAGNEFQPITYLERGVIAARAVAFLELRTPSGGDAGAATGFMIAPRVLITNNHVFHNAAEASRAIVKFRYEVDLNDAPRASISYRLDPTELFHTSEQLDFSVVAVAATADDGTPLSSFGCLPLLDITGKASEGEWLTIIQHPNRERKQICVRENQLIERLENMIRYSTDTQPGSSGSPVFNNDWFVVALHHSGVAEEKNGIWQTINGTDYDPNTMDESQVKWIANEGVRASRIAQALKADLPNHPLLQPLYSATPASARIGEPAGSPPSPSSISPPPPRPPTESTAMANSSFPLDIRLRVQPDGQVNIVHAGTESADILEARGLERARPAAHFDAPFDDDYEKRGGFNPDFLGGGKARVGFPKLSAALDAVAAPIEPPYQPGKILHYNNYSVVMHKKRRFAIYSAANVKYDKRYKMSRPPDVWRRDPRIRSKYQIENWYYASNKFDRGHLTRREDLEFGDEPQTALSSAGDTCHWTNCTPQHAKFNQNKEIWHGIELHVLEDSIFNGQVNAQIITGPILDEGDPTYREVQYPLQFWKVVAALKSNGDLFATAYVAGQEEVIAQFGIEVTEVPFGPYKTFQVKIAEIERLTGLTFVCGPEDKKFLRDFDPLPKLDGPRGRRRRASPNEAFSRAGLEGYFEIAQLDDIQL